MGMTLNIKQSHRSQNKPAAQLALVFILSEAITVDRGSSVKLITDVTGPFLGQPRLARIIEQPGLVETGLITMVVQLLHA